MDETMNDQAPAQEPVQEQPQAAQEVPAQSPEPQDAGAVAATSNAPSPVAEPSVSGEAPKEEPLADGVQAASVYQAAVSADAGTTTPAPQAASTMGEASDAEIDAQLNAVNEQAPVIDERRAGLIDRFEFYLESLSEKIRDDAKSIWNEFKQHL